MEQKYLRYIGLLLLPFALLFSYQNCSQVSFDEPYIFKRLCKFEVCTEYLLETKSITNTEKVKVVLVVDNSHSMTDIQERLGQAIQKTLIGFEGNALEFYVFSTTQLSSAAYKPSRYPQGPDAGNFPIMGIENLYSFEKNGELFYSLDYPSEAGLLNPMVDHQLYISPLRAKVYPPANPVTDYPGLVMLDTNLDGYIDKNDFDNVVTGCMSADYDCDINDDGSVNSLDFFEFSTILASDSAYDELEVYFASNPEKINIEINPQQSSGLAKFYLLMLAQRVQTMGTSGSDIETGICALNQIVHERRHPIFSRGDRAAFIVISDEEDQSTVQNCIKNTKHTMLETSSSTVCDPTVESCSTTRYRIKFANSLMLQTSCVAGYQDGTNDPIFSKFFDVLDKNTCVAGYSRSCTADELAESQAMCSSYVPDGSHHSCRVECSNGEGTGVQSYISSLGYSVTVDYVAGQNLCDPAQIYKDGMSIYQHYDTNYGKRILDPSLCHQEHYSGQVYYSKQTNAPIIELLFPNLSSDDQLIDSFIEKADSLFGRSNYFVNVITHDATTDPLYPNCDVAAQGSGSSYGNKYIDLAQRVMGTTANLSICADTYNQPIENLKKFTTTTIVRTYDISKYDIANIYRVGLRRNGVSYQLAVDQYQINGTTLIISSGVIQPGDQILLAYK